MVEKVYITYNQVHKLCQAAGEQILNEFNPNLMIAIGGGGYVPARILRKTFESYRNAFKNAHAVLPKGNFRADGEYSSFLRRPDTANIPIQAIGLSLYEQLPSTSTNGTAEKDIEAPGTKVTRTQWLDLSSLEMENLIGKNILIVDEVDDTRTTLEYAVRELEKDVEEARKRAGKTGSEGKTTFSIFVLHNKDKDKRGHLPQDMMDEKRYLAARTVPDVWICYPWEATDIDEHDHLAQSSTIE